MLYIQLLEAFEIEIGKIDDNFTKPKTADTEYFLNCGLDKYWKSRYSLNNSKKKSFEETLKRTDDLRTLVKEVKYTMEDITTVNSSLYTVVLPDDYNILLGDTAGISPADGIENECWAVDEDGNYVIHYSDTIEGQIETIDRIRENSLSEYHLKFCKAKPIRLMADNTIKLYTDGLYQVAEYIMLYLRKPMVIDIHSNPFDDYTDMPEHTQIEIVKLAALLYILNQMDPRYTTYTQEIIPSME